MANYNAGWFPNPYVRLERLSIDKFLSISHSSLEEQKKVTYRFESTSEDASSDSEVEESDLERYSNYSKEFNPYSKSEKKKRKWQKIDVNQLTEYEKLVLKNKNEKNAFLDSLKINEVKAGLSEAIKNYTKGGKRILKPKLEIVPRPKMARSSKVYINLSERAVAKRTLSKARETLEVTPQKEIVEELPTLLNLKDVLNSDQSYECFLHNLKDLDKGNTVPIDEYESRFQDMELLESHVACFNKTTVTAMDIHPMQENTIIASGGYNGNLYLWNMNSDSIPYAFQVHSKRISHLKFNPGNPHLIMSASHDGTLREGDLVAHIYNKLTKDSNCNYFDFLSPDTCLVSHNDGYVSVVDMRDMRARNRKRRMAHKCDNIGIRTVSVHPVNKNEFITPTYKGCVKLWDLRKLQKHPVMEARHENHNNNYTRINSAIFSPLTGKSVLTTSGSGRICIFDTSLWNITSSCKLSKKRPPHSQATWQPRTDHKFAVGNLNLRKIEIWNYNQKMYSAFHELLQGLVSFCTFHPSLPIIAAVQNSKVYVFANKDH